MKAGPGFALLAACGALFGASFAAAELTEDEKPERAQPTAAPLPEPVVPDAPNGRSLALSRAAGLPELRKRPRPKPEPATPSASVVVARPAAPAPPPPPPPDDGGVEAEPAPESDPAPSGPSDGPTSTPATPSGEFYESEG